MFITNYMLTLVMKGDATGRMKSKKGGMEMTKKHVCYMTSAGSRFEHTPIDEREIRARCRDTAYPTKRNVVHGELSVAVINGNKFHVIHD